MTALPRDFIAAPISDRRENPPAVAAALLQYDLARTDAERPGALAALARVRADQRSTDLAAEAQRVIDHLAAQWTAWREVSP